MSRSETAKALKKEYLSLRAYLFDRSKKNLIVRKAKSEKMDRIISELISLGVTEIEVPGSVGYDGKPVTVKLEENAKHVPSLAHFTS